MLGVELSQLAVDQFFVEHDLQPVVHKSHLGTHFTAGAIELVCGDVFSLEAAVLAGCTGVYDRAALIALPPAMRERYVRAVYAQLPPGCRGLLVTLEYPPHEKAGPPFSIDQDHVQVLYEREWNIDLLEHRDILDTQPGFVAEGVTRLFTTVYQLERKP